MHKTLLASLLLIAQILGATLYANFDLTTGNNDGTTKVDAYQSLADLCAGVSDGDVVACTGTDAGGATLGTAGTVANGGISWIAYDATLTTPTVGGCVIDGAGAVTNGLVVSTGSTVMQIVGFEFDDFTTRGVFNNNGDGLWLVDCYVHDSPTLVDCTNERTYLIHCTLANGTDAIKDCTAGLVRNCLIHTISANGVSGSVTDFNGNLVYDVTGHAITTSSGALVATFNTIDGGGDDAIECTGATSSNSAIYIYKNLVTNTTGYAVSLTNANSIAFGDYNRWYSNSSGNFNTAGAYWGGDNDAVLTGDPYTNSSSDDYTLADADAYNIQTKSGWREGSNAVISYEAAGALAPECGAGGGGATLGGWESGSWR